MAKAHTPEGAAFEVKQKKKRCKKTAHFLTLFLVVLLLYVVKLSASELFSVKLPNTPNHGKKKAFCTPPPPTLSAETTNTIICL